MLLATQTYTGPGPAGGEIVILLLIPTILYTCQIVFNRQIKTKLDKRPVGLTVAVVYFVYFFIVAGLPNIIQAFKDISIGNHTGDNPLNAEDSRKVSGVFALDVCQFLAIFFPIAIILDPSKKVARALAPTAITGGIFTLVTRVALDKTTELTGSGVFLGMSGKAAAAGVFDYPNHAAFYLYHVINMAIAIAILLQAPRAGKKGVLGMLIAQAGYYAYVGLVIAATTATYSVAGLTTHDFMEGGNFKQIAKLLHASPAVALVSFHAITVGMAVGIGALNDFVFKKHKRWADDPTLFEKKLIIKKTISKKETKKVDKKPEDKKPRKVVRIHK